MSSAGVFELTFRVPDADVDPLGHVNNVAYVRYVQDVAVAHWRAVAPAEVQAAVTWVVRRHEIDYLRPALPGDTLAVRTWVGEPSGATWDRYTEVTRPADGTVLARARTVWVLLDGVTGRPRRVDAGLTKHFTDGADGPGDRSA